ncbi:hypothetical protein BH24BAC1_BH24BAC1_00790 [soil metagenome]
MTKFSTSAFFSPCSFRILLGWTGLFFLSFFPFRQAYADHPCLLIPLSLENRTQAAPVIVEGKVVAQHAFWDEGRHNIYTSSTVEIYKVFKGSLQSTLVEVVTEGGQVGETMHVFSSTLRLRLNQQGMFFLKQARHRSAAAPARRPAFGVYGSLQGFIRYNLPAQTAQDPFQTYASIPTELYGTLQGITGTEHRVVQPNPAVLAHPAPQETNRVEDVQAVPVVTSFAPTSVTAGTRLILTINGLNFGASRGQGKVGFRNADDGGRTFINPLPTDYVSWSDTQIRVRVPSNGMDGGTAGTGQVQVTHNEGSAVVSAGSLTVVYAYSNVEHEGRSYIPDLVNRNGAGGYTFRFSNNFNNNLAARNAFNRALTNWRCETSVNWTVGQPTNITASTDDNISTVRFDAGPELPENTLGRTISRYNGCGFVGGELNWYVSEVDMEFNDETNWQFGPAQPGTRQYDFEGIVLHELGHAHQLSHIILPRAVMHFGAGTVLANRVLDPENDLGGAMAVIANSVVNNICGPTRMEPVPADRCRLPADIVSLRARFQTSQGVVLNWTTQSETNMAFFIVERSPDGLTWTEVGRVPGGGTTQAPREYQAVDPDPLPGISFYRLRITNTVGQFGFSEVVQVIDREIAGLILYPNPVEATEGIEGTEVQGIFEGLTDEATLTIRVFDNAGRLQHTLSLSISRGTNFLNITLPSLSGGLYHLRWDDGSHTGSSKLVKI